MILDHYYQHTIDHCSDIAQVSLFIGVLCSVILSISHRAAELIMGLLHLVLRLAFTPTVGGEMSILQQNTLEQIPMNITSALSRFNLHPSTTVYATCCRAAVSTSWFSSQAYPWPSILVTVQTNQSHGSLFAISPCSNSLQLVTAHPLNHMSTIIFTTLWQASFQDWRLMQSSTSVMDRLVLPRPYVGGHRGHTKRGGCQHPSRK